VRDRFLVARLILAAFLGLPALVRAGDIKLSDWAFTAPVEIQGAGPRPVAEFALTPEIVAATRPGMEDLRIVARGSDEIGYVVRTAQGSTQSLPLQVRLYNRTFLSGKESSVTVDFAAKILKNRVQVITAGTNFRRRIRVEGSDDGERWQSVRDGAFLFRVQHADGTNSAYDGNVVTFPDNDLRYLKITVANSEDDQGVVDIKDVKAGRELRTMPDTTAVPVTASKVEQKKRTTELTLDLGYPNLLLHELELAFSDPNFFRNVTVWGRNQETRVMKRIVEDSPALDKTVEVPWNRIADGVVFRFSGEGTVEESLRVGLNDAKYRYLLVRIENRNDSPLNFWGARVTRLIQHVAFATSKADSYSLYTGNVKIAAPPHDIGHYMGKLSVQGASEAAVGKLIANPLYKQAKKKVPWSEQHKEILWVALLAMAAALGGLVYRMARAATKAP
jgi:hypothetical protein